MLGRWCFESNTFLDNVQSKLFTLVSSMSYLKRQLAKSFIGEVPTTSFEEVNMISKAILVFTFSHVRLEKASRKLHNLKVAGYWTGCGCPKLTKMYGLRLEINIIYYCFVNCFYILCFGYGYSCPNMQKPLAPKLQGWLFLAQIRFIFCGLISVSHESRRIKMRKLSCQIWKLKLEPHRLWISSKVAPVHCTNLLNEYIKSRNTRLL